MITKCSTCFKDINTDHVIPYRYVDDGRELLMIFYCSEHCKDNWKCESCSKIIDYDGFGERYHVKKLKDFYRVNSYCSRKCRVVREL